MSISGGFYPNESQLFVGVTEFPVPDSRNLQDNLAVVAAVATVVAVEA